VLGIACSPKQETPPTANREKGPPQVTTITASAANWSETIHAFGVISSSAEVELSVPFSARVDEVKFTEGARVEEGQVLVRFEAVSRRQRLRQSRASVNDIKGALKRAREDLAKTKGLVASSAVSAADVDAAEDTLRQAQARYDDSVASLRLAEHDVRETTLRSPVAGVVQSRTVDVGETVNAGSAIAIIQAVDTLRVETYVSEREVNAIEIGGVATVTSAGARGQEYTARVESIGIQAEPETGNFPVKLAIASSPEPSAGLLRPGMTARVALQGAIVPNTIAVPTRAIVDRHRERVLFIVQDGKALERVPILGLTDESWTPVYEGLSVGEMVVIEGLPLIIDNVEVAASETDNPPPRPKQIISEEADAPESEDANAEEPSKSKDEPSDSSAKKSVKSSKGRR